MKENEKEKTGGAAGAAAKAAEAFGRKKKPEDAPAEEKAETIEEPTAEDLKKQVEFLKKQVEFLTKQAAVAEAKAKEAAEKLEEQTKKDLNDYMRLQADFDNFRRRTRENDAKAADIYKAETLKSFLPVLDNFELALAHMKKDESGEAYIQGFELLQKQLVKIMTDYGISEIEAAGQKFDPHFHEAVMMVESNDKEDETVLAVFQKGYMYKDTVLRPAKVQVVHNN
jgi:molecular chaperone GrpE